MKMIKKIKILVLFSLILNILSSGIEKINGIKHKHKSSSDKVVNH